MFAPCVDKISKKIVRGVENACCRVYRVETKGGNMAIFMCSRVGCENSLSELYSCDYGHLCDDCFEELVERPWVDIEVFLENPPNEGIDDPSLIAWREHLDDIFVLKDVL